MDPALWRDLFHPDISILEKIVRPVVVYVFLIVGLRLAGKRELAQLNAFDLVVLLTISNTVQNAIIGDDNSVTGGAIGAITLLVTNYLVVRFLFGHRRLDQLVEGQPSVLMRGGHLLKKELAREMMTRSELEVVVRRQGFDGLDAVDEVVLEPGGAIVIRGKTPPKSELNHSEVVSRLDAILTELRARRA